MRSKMGEQGETSKKVVRFCLQGAARINRCFVYFTSFVQVIILPQLTSYQYRVYFIYLAQLCSCDLALIFIAKSLQVGYKVDNFLLLLSLGNVMPFLRTVRSIWVFIPCPPMAAVISNSALLFALIVLLMLGIGTYDGEVFVVYTYIMSVWPWLVLASMVARLYIERNIQKNPFSPVRGIPLLGITGAMSQVLSLLAAKHISITDCIMLYGLDPVLAAIMASFMLSAERRKLHFRNVKMYVMMLILILIYSTGELGPGEVAVAIPSYYHFLFAVGRVLAVARSIYVKWQYATFNHAEAPKRPPENDLLFYGSSLPQIHRFTGYPAPLLLTLDAIFDSGLRDSEFHGMGPLGTQDLHMLTDGAYLLPLSTIAAWVYEQSTLTNGVLPPSLYLTNPTAVQMVNENAPTSLAAESAQLVHSTITTFDNIFIWFLLICFCTARLLAPWASAQILFDRGSSLHVWKYQPILIVIPFFLFDVLYLNDSLSKFQIVVALALAGVIAYYRADLWNTFKRKYLLLCTQDLYYHHPAVLRQLQRRTLLEFLQRTSTEDYGFLLMETSIRHGMNVQELARDTNVKVWDPTPAATAAWKLAFSLVTKSLKRQKLLRQQRTDTKNEIDIWIGNLVLEITGRAVDLASAHGGRLRLAGSLSKNFDKRRALRRLKALAMGRRTLRQKRKTGQLAVAPAALASAGGVIRSIRDMPQQTKGRVAQMPLPSSPNSKRGTLLSLTAGPEAATIPEGSENAPLLAVPGELPAEPLEQGSPAPRTATDGPPRGVWATSSTGGDPSSIVGSIVLAFGDTRRGQLGLEPGVATRQAARTTVTVVEELRGCEPVQVEASGVSSFVVTARGQLWGFGSNRSMELGLRKEVSQVNTPQRVKSIRERRAVQIAGSSSISGQAHTLMLTTAGEVCTWGTSSCGALGQGSDVRQSAPLSLRMSTQRKVKLLAAGARHSLFVIDGGKLYTVGDNRHGQLGVGRRDGRCAHEPEPVEGELAEQRVRLIAAGDDHALAATEDGRLFVWGASANGQLGLGRMDDQAVPVPLRDLQGIGITSLACGARHSLVVARQGKQVWAFGSNVCGQLGMGRSSPADGYQLGHPVLCQALSGKREMDIVQVAAASSHSLAVTRTGEVYSFGDNSYGQLGFHAEGQGYAPAAARTRSSHAAAAGAAANTPFSVPVAQDRVAMEIDAPNKLMEGVAQLWEPTRIVSLALYRVLSVSTADTHTLALAA